MKISCQKNDQESEALYGARLGIAAFIARSSARSSGCVVNGQDVAPSRA